MSHINLQESEEQQWGGLSITFFFWVCVALWRRRRRRERKKTKEKEEEEQGFIALHKCSSTRSGRELPTLSHQFFTHLLIVLLTEKNKINKDLKGKSVIMILAKKEKKEARLIELKQLITLFSVEFCFFFLVYWIFIVYCWDFDFLTGRCWDGFTSYMCLPLPNHTVYMSLTFFFCTHTCHLHMYKTSAYKITN